MLYASEPAPAYTPADRFAQLQVAHSCEQKRSSHSSSPERRQYRDAPTVVGGFAQEQQPQQQQHLHQQQEAPGGEDQWRIPATPCTAPPPLDDSQARQQQYEQEEEDVVLDEPFSWKKVGLAWSVLLEAGRSCCSTAAEPGAAWAGDGGCCEPSMWGAVDNGIKR